MDKNFLDQVIAELISGLSDSIAAIAAIAAATARTGNAQAFQEAYTAELAHIQRSTPNSIALQLSTQALGAVARVAAVQHADKH